MSKLKIKYMKTINKILKTIIILFSFMACSQTTMKSVNDAKKLEINKKNFIGKPFNYLLKNIDVKIKSVIPFPNKNVKEINRLSILFVSAEIYKKSGAELSSKPTRMTVVFNQNWEFKGERCTYDKPGCAEWTNKDEKNLGQLIISDIYVTGKN